MPFESVLVEAYKGTRRKHNMKFRQIGNTTSQCGTVVFFLKLLGHETGLLLLKLRHWLYLDQIFLIISVHPLLHNTLEGSCGILKHKKNYVPNLYNLIKFWNIILYIQRVIKFGRLFNLWPYFPKSCLILTGTFTAQIDIGLIYIYHDPYRIIP